MIRKKRRVIFTVLWIAVMVIIFRFSNDDAEASSAKSEAVVMIVETVEEVLDLTPTQEIRAMTEMIVRKCAHVFLYTCLGITGTLAVREYVGPILENLRRRRVRFGKVNRPARRIQARPDEKRSDSKFEKAENLIEIKTGKIRAVTAFVTYILCFFYACTDEWHQTFRSGRSGSFRDVMIDSIGMVLGIGIVTLASALWNHFYKKRSGKIRPE